MNGPYIAAVVQATTPARCIFDAGEAMAAWARAAIPRPRDDVE